MRLVLRLGLVGAALMLATCGKASTQELCEEACAAMQSCDDGGNSANRVASPYDFCMDICKEEGDWNRRYVDCITEQYWCTDQLECD